MASILLHLCVSNIVKEELCLPNDFFVGSVLPDLLKLNGKDRNETHYNTKIQTNSDINFGLPNLEMFISKNEAKLTDYKTIGYYAHLVEDKVWFKKYIYNYISQFKDEFKINKVIENGDMDILKPFWRRIYSDYDNNTKYVISNYNLNLEDISKYIIDNLNDSMLVDCYKDYLKLLERKSEYEKVFYLTSEDVSNYVKDSVKEVKEKIKELGGIYGKYCIT